MTIVEIPLSLAILVSPIAVNTATTPPIKALTAIVNVPPAKKIMAMAAPRFAPEDTTII